MSFWEKRIFMRVMSGFVGRVEVRLQGRALHAPAQLQFIQFLNGSDNRFCSNHLLIWYDGQRS